jgi:hypothetical protein
MLTAVLHSVATALLCTLAGASLLQPKTRVRGLSEFFDLRLCAFNGSRADAGGLRDYELGRCSPSAASET